MMAKRWLDQHGVDASAAMVAVRHPQAQAQAGAFIQIIFLHLLTDWRALFIMVVCWFVRHDRHWY